MAKEFSPEERKALILKKIAESGRILASGAAIEFGVSEDSIRRDLRELADQGLVSRFHGGAARMKSGARSFSERAVQKSDERQAIAAVAAGRIPANSTLLLDASVTVLEFVRSLAADLEASFITTSPEVALAALDRQFSEVILIGGRLNPQTRSALGPSAYSTVQSLSADFCILGACAVDADLVVRAENYDDAYLKLAMISACSEVILLTTSDKLLKQSAFAVGPISLITTLITDEAADEDILKRIRETGVEVVIARNAS